MGKTRRRGTARTVSARDRTWSKNGYGHYEGMAVVYVTRTPYPRSTITIAITITITITITRARRHPIAITLTLQEC